MKPRIHVITLAVADLDRALAFYRDGLGFPTEGLIGTEFTGDETTPGGTTAVFHLDRGLMLSIYPRSELAKDAGIPLSQLDHVVLVGGSATGSTSPGPARPEPPSPSHRTTGRGASTRGTSGIPTATCGRSSGTPRWTSPGPEWSRPERWPAGLAARSVMPDDEGEDADELGPVGR